MYMPGQLPDVNNPPIWGSAWPPSQLDTLDIPSEIDWLTFDSDLQGQSHMLPQSNWASPPPSNHASLANWVDLASGLNVGTNTMPDLTNPLNLWNSTGYVPPYQTEF